ncbi:MAG: YaeQ family protein [Gemmatimonadaceae bacterium]
MALSATLYTFDVNLADVDRGVYETLAIRAACQPSETQEYLLSRVLAYCLEYAEGIAFSKGIAEPDVPAVSVRDLTGALRVWIDVGAPDAARLHKASKAAPRVAIYTHRDAARLAAQLAGEKIHRAEDVELYGISRELIDGLVQRLDRRNKWDVSVTERHVYVTIGAATVDGAVERHALA